MGVPNTAHIRMTSSLPGMSRLLGMSRLPGMSSLPGMSAYESDEMPPTYGDEQNPLNQENEAHSQSRKIAQSNHT
jgi:hypothetical protein